MRDGKRENIMAKTKTIAISLPKEVAKASTELARLTRMSRSKFIATAIKYYIDDVKDKTTFDHLNGLTFDEIDELIDEAKDLLNREARVYSDNYLWPKL